MTGAAVTGPDGGGAAAGPGGRIRWARQIALAGRLALAGRRESAARLAITAVGICLAVVMLLFGAVALPALHAHAARNAWTRTSAHNTAPAPHPAGASPVLWQLSQDHFRGQDITWVNVAALGPRPVLPPGLSRLPGPGQLAVSPALARLLATTPADQLRDRFGGGRVTGTVGDAALVSPGQLVVFQGWRPDQLRHRPGTDTVRSIETSTGGGLAATGFLRLMVLVGLAGLLVPVIVLVLTATRLGAARREQRLAAMRLAGATPAQISGIAAAEAVTAAVAGTVAGFAGFLALRPRAAAIPVDGSPFFPGDLRLSALTAVAIALGVPALSGLAAVAALRRVQVSPLGVARQAVRRRARLRRLIPLAAGLVGYGLAVARVAQTQGSNNSPVYLVALAFVLVIVGLVIAGPVLTNLVAILIRRLTRRTPGLLAARHLEGNPAAGFRAISGLVLATFVATVIAGVTPATLGATRTGYTAFPADLVIQQFTLPPPQPERSPGVREVSPAVPGLSPAEATALLSRLTAIPGVRGVTALRQPPAGSTRLGAGTYTGKFAPYPVVASCAGLAAAGLAHCSPGQTEAVIDASALTSGTIGGPHISLLRPLPAAQLATRPLAAVAVVTTGSPATVEQVRTILDAGRPGLLGPAETSADINAAANQKLAHLSELADAALLITLIIAGCSLAVAVAGGLLERRRPLTLLRLAGVRRSELTRMVLAESALPLLALAAVSVALGLGVAAGLLVAAGSGSNVPWKPPQPPYWLSLGAGLTLAVLIVAATLPLLHRLTALDNARFE
jgi:cell division protein FtsX